MQFVAAYIVYKRYFKNKKTEEGKDEEQKKNDPNFTPVS